MTAPAPGRRGASPASLKFLLLVLGVALLLFLGWRFALPEVVKGHTDQIRAFIYSLGPWGPVLYVAIYATVVPLAFPAVIMTAIAALLFGTGGGTLVALAGATAGASLAFLIARYLGREFVAERLGGRWKAVDKDLRAGGFSYLLFLRMMPLVPFNLLNYGCGLTDIRFRDFALATALGIIPGTFIYCYTTTSLVNAQQVKGPLLLAFSLLGLMALAPLAYRKWRGSGRARP